jgi:hypothetical protein
MHTASAEWYVSVTDGNDDAGTGAIDPPYKTIEKAMAESNSGDTCVIREGVYRETIVFEVNHLMIKALEGEGVSVSVIHKMGAGSKFLRVYLEA